MAIIRVGKLALIAVSSQPGPSRSIGSPPSGKSSFAEFINLEYDSFTSIALAESGAPYPLERRDLIEASRGRSDHIDVSPIHAEFEVLDNADVQITDYGSGYKTFVAVEARPATTAETTASAEVIYMTLRDNSRR